MTEFNTPIDIANRSCQHCGVRRIDPVQGFNEASDQASAIGFAYGKLRRAELQRNLWTFAIKKVVLRPVGPGTMMLAAALWMSSTTYFVGSIVSDSTGNYWISRQANNLGNEPLTTPAWDPYCGPLTVSLYDSTAAYSSGELVYTAAGDGTNRVYLSLQDGNSDNPATGTAWDAPTTYFKNQTVSYLTVAYQSLIDLNSGNMPSDSPAAWDPAVVYNVGDSAAGSNGLTYTSVVAGNTGVDPTLDDGSNWSNTGALTPWTSVFVGGTGSLKWLEIGGAEFPTGVTLLPPNIVYPIGAGPSSQSSSRNAYRLPARYLRRAPQDPKAGIISWLGAPGNAVADDWVIENGYLTTACSDALMLRFVADLTDVRQMHDMFCEGLAARIALAVCEELTQSREKVGTIGQEYNKFMGEARLSSAIESGAVEPPLDDWIAARY